MECGSSSKSFFSCSACNRDGFFHVWRVLGERLGGGLVIALFMKLSLKEFAM